MLTSAQWRGWLAHFQNDRDGANAKLRDAAKSAGLTCEAEWLTP